MSNPTFTNREARPIVESDILYLIDSTGKIWKYKYSDLNFFIDSTTGAITCTTLTATGAADLQSTVSIGGTATVATNKKLQFRDTGIYLQSSADGTLDIVSDTTVAISGEITADSSLTVSGVLTTDSAHSYPP